MPVHDWTRVGAWLFRCFHSSWITHLMAALNGGLLPERLYAQCEQNASRVQRGRYLVIRHLSGHQVIALIEIVSPSNKDRRAHVRELAEKVVRSLEAGVHVLVLDLLPPTAHDPHGMHGEVWRYFDTGPYEPPPDGPLTLASYVWDGDEPRAYIEPMAVGRALIDMPLFLSAERYANVPLETTYLAAYRGMPEYWRDVLEGVVTEAVE